MRKDFSIKEVKTFARNGNINEWVYDFLIGPGNNKGMAAGMKKREKSGSLFWIGPIFFPLKNLIRCCGPEKTMEYPQTQKSWEVRVNALKKSIQKGWEPPVLIANPRPWPILSLRDGNHRHEALKRTKKRKYWTLFWFENKKERDSFAKKYL